jgi:hypothetical protein
MLQARLSSSELAKRACIPQGSINFYVASGLLVPSIQRGRGKGHPNVFGFRDLVIATAVSKMRLPNISAEGMQEISAFWRSRDDNALRNMIHVDGDVDAKKEVVDAGQVLLLLGDGRLVIEENLRVLDLTQKYGSAVVHVVDAGRLASDAFFTLIEDRLADKLVQPGPSGRLPRRPKPAMASPMMPEKMPRPHRDGQRAPRRDALRGEVRRKKSSKKEPKDK